MKTNNVLLLSAGMGGDHSPEPIHFQRLAIKTTLSVEIAMLKANPRCSCLHSLAQSKTQPLCSGNSLRRGDARPTIANYPEQRFTLRNGILVIRQHPRN